MICLKNRLKLLSNHLINDDRRFLMRIRLQIDFANRLPALCHVQLQCRLHSPEEHLIIRYALQELFRCGKLPIEHILHQIDKDTLLALMGVHERANIDTRFFCNLTQRRRRISILYKQPCSCPKNEASVFFR